MLAGYISRSPSLDLAFIEVLNTIRKLYIGKAVGGDAELKLYRTLRLLEEVEVEIEPARIYMDEAMEIALDISPTIYDPHQNLALVIMNSAHTYQRL